MQLSSLLFVTNIYWKWNMLNRFTNLIKDNSLDHYYKL